MKKNQGLIIGIVVTCLLIYLTGFSAVRHYNRMVGAYSAVETAQADVEVQLQRRFDLIPSVVSTVQTALNHEELILETVTETRAVLSGASGKDQLISTEQVDFDRAVAALIAAVEADEGLISDQAIRDLITELEGCENRILIARKDYNQAASTYNQTISEIPARFFADWVGFEKVDLFTADQTAKFSPQVTFSVND